MNHRRRIELEDKAKVVASVWGKNLLNSLPPSLFCLGRFERNGRIVSVELTETIEFNRFFQIDLGKTASARQGIEQMLPPKQTRRPLPRPLILSFFYDTNPLMQATRVWDYKTSGKMNIAEEIST